MPTVTINDAGGSTTTDSGTTTVADAPLTATGDNVSATGGISTGDDDGCHLHRRQS